MPEYRLYITIVLYLVLSLQVSYPVFSMQVSSDSALRASIGKSIPTRSYISSLFISDSQVKPLNPLDSEKDTLANSKITATEILPSLTLKKDRWQFSFGSAFLPVKLRMGNGRDRYFDFNSDYTLGSTFGFQYRLSRHKPRFVNFLAGFGLGSVELDSLNTRGRISGTLKQLSYSPSLGIIFNIHQLNIGFFTGSDLLIRQYARLWVHQGIPWLSMGIGVQLFSRNIETLGRSQRESP